MIEQNKTDEIDSPSPPKLAPLHMHISKTQVGKKFQYRHQVQCQMCQAFGHDINKDICQIGAQIYHVTKFQAKATKNAENAEKNATVYSLANHKSTIKVVCHETDPTEVHVERAEQLTIDLLKASPS